MASVLFTDIVGFSRNPLEKQISLLDHLQQIVRGTTEYQRAERAGTLIKLPTGDGMALVFFHDPVAPVRCAIEIQNVLKAHPALPLRTGVHTGPIYRQSDIKDNVNVVGGGINIAQRVMDCGDAGHILVSRAVAEVLEQLDEWPDCVKDLGYVEVKHGVKIQIYNVTRDGAGNPELPAKLQKIPAPPPAPPPPVPKNLLPVWVGLGVVVLAAVAWLAIRAIPAPASIAAKTGSAVGAPLRKLRYHVMLQKYNGDVKVGTPARLPGEAAIETGNGIRLVLSAGEPGYLYVLNEGAESTTDKPDFNIFFPSPARHGGSSHLEKDDEIRIPDADKDYLRFDSQKGTEKFWIVWSTEKIQELEDLKKWATTKDQGVVKDLAQARALPGLLHGYPAENPPVKDSVNKMTELRASGKILVHLINWEHY
jgi:class 3 adenylate cyclase